MFDILSSKMLSAIKGVNKESHITEKNSAEIIRQIRMSLLAADVNFKVIQKFITNIKDEIINTTISHTTSPEQQVIAIVHKEIQDLLGNEISPLTMNHAPTIVLMVGLQGSGKTTTSAKLANLLKKKGYTGMIIAADIYRPAAIEQLQTLGKQINVPVYERGEKNPVEICTDGIQHAIEQKYEYVIVDTAGRLQIDENMMNELKQIVKKINPHEVLIVVDGMTGQEIINVAAEFDRNVKLTGTIITKLDGDARGGAALSIRSITNIPIKYIGMGEKIGELSEFHPKRMADRILGMGDIETLIEKAGEVMEEKSAKKIANKFLEGRFTLDDLINQLRQIKKIGKFSAIMKMIPGAPKLTKDQKDLAEEKLENMEILVNSMTMEERQNPKLLEYASRKKRIVKGSGKSIQDYNKLLKEWKVMKEQSKNLKSMFSKQGNKFF